MKLKCPVKASWTVLFLKLEAFVAVLLGLYLFQYFGGSWLLFACFFLVPDLSMIAYIFGSKVGALIYNVAHTTVGPILLAGYSFAAEKPSLLLFAFIWGCHIYFDRFLGIGLKSPKGFNETHMGTISFGKSKKKLAE